MWKGMPSNSQELFDQCVTHLLTQKERCVDEDDNCVYRGGAGKKCAIGGVLPDNLYKKVYESSDAVTVLVAIKHPSVKGCETEAAGLKGLRTIKGDRPKFAELATALQLIHDEEDVVNWHDELLNIGRKFKLNLSVLNTFKES